MTGRAPKGITQPVARRLRILYVDLAPSVGGSVISLYYLIKGLDRSRFEPIVALASTNPYAEHFRQLGIPMHLVQTRTTGLGQDADSTAVATVRRGGVIKWLKRSRLGAGMVHWAGFWLRAYPHIRRQAYELSELMRTVRPNLVHLNDVVSISRAGILAARTARVPAICHVRAISTRNAFDRRLSRSLCGYICISRAVDQHQRSLGGRVGPSWVVYNGLDLGDVNPNMDQTLIRKELALPDGVPLIGCVGRLVEWKGQHVFLEALGQLAKNSRSFHALLVGAGETSGQDYVHGLYRQVADLGLQDRVTFTGYRKDVLSILPGLDVMVHASVRPEPFGRVIIEGMASGTSVIGTSAGAVPEILEHKKTGLIVPPDDSRAMAEAIDYVLEHPEEASRWRAAARRTVEERFTMEAYVSGVQCVYEGILQ